MDRRAGVSTHGRLVRSGPIVRTEPSAKNAGIWLTVPDRVNAEL